MVSKSPVLNRMFAHYTGVCLLLLPFCCRSVLELSCTSSLVFVLKSFFPISSVWQVWEGCVLPRCCSVVHWVWECIGEKCSGIQVPVPYVFRNCGINQVSIAKHIQKSSGWERDLEIRASRSNEVLPPTFETSYHSPIKLDHLQFIPVAEASNVFMKVEMLSAKALEVSLQHVTHEKQNYSNYYLVSILFRVWERFLKWWRQLKLEIHRNIGVLWYCILYFVVYLMSLFVDTLWNWRITWHRMLRLQIKG